MTARTDSTVMSMYSDLLAASLEGTSPEDTSVPAQAATGEMLVHLLECRHRLVAVADPARPPTSPADLAVHLDYDRALVTFCRARGIHTDPSRFAVLHRERRRLEEELLGLGVDLEALDA
jgi:hypothetical protein